MNIDTAISHYTDWLLEIKHSTEPDEVDEAVEQYEIERYLDQQGEECDKLR